MKNIWTKKNLTQLLAEAHENKGGLKRSLTRLNLVMLGIGGIIGAGIFALAGTAAANYAGPAVTISFIVAGIACAFAGLCYAELASMIPIAGSAYTYAYATMGEFIAWIIGWDLILEYLFACSTVAVGWSGYAVSFLDSFGLHIPKEWANAPVSYDATTHQWASTGAVINVPAMVIIFVLCLILIKGIKESASLNNMIVLLKLTVIFLFILFGFKYVNADNLTPYIPENTGNWGSFGWSGVLRASGVIFFAYIGFDSVSTAAQEAKNPQKDMPWGILGSLAVCTVIYIIFGTVMTGMVSYKELNVSAPVAVAVDATGGALSWLSPFIKLGALAGLSSVILIMALGQSRVFYSMSKDGLLPEFLGKVHPTFKTPYIATIVTGATSMLIGGFFPIGLLGELVSIGTLLAFAIVCAGVLVLRYKQPDFERPFKAPLFPLTPILGIATSVGVMASLPLDTWIRLFIWMALGFAFYFIYGNKHSKINNG
jgi:basic amino acid/polyamine antiporter, APA family